MLMITRWYKYLSKAKPAHIEDYIAAVNMPAAARSAQKQLPHEGATWWHLVG